MKECIIFGAGSFGKKGYYKLCRDFHILAYSDNNPDTWGTSINEITVISPDMLKKNKEIMVIICSTYYDEIEVQLRKLGMKNIWYISPENFLLHPCDNSVYNTCDTRKKLKSVLFVQETQCIRTYRMAKILKKQGIKVDLAFLDKSPLLNEESVDMPYEKIIPINSIKGFLEFVNKSDYDIIHCSNEPDYLTALLIQCSNKKIIHDTHDMTSLKKDCSMDELVNEYIANVKADGNLYVAENGVNIAKSKFGINSDKIMIVPNVPIKEFLAIDKIKKISSEDGEIHCVYEGSIVCDDEKHHRFFEKIFLKLAENKIHIHIYIPSTSPLLVMKEYFSQLKKMSSYIHFEGSLEPQKLFTELTKYDVGLAMFNVTKKNKVFLESTFTTKIYDYLVAGLPVAVSNVDTHKKFVEENNVGLMVDLQGDILQQFKKILNINIPDNILENKKMYLDWYVKEIIEFYEKILNKKCR